VNAGQSTAIRSREEVADAIYRFTAADWARLKKIASVYAAGRPIEADDLLQEALCRAFDEHGRHCPAHVGVVKFLAGAMRSIAHGESEKVRDNPKLVAIANYGEQEGVPDPPDETLKAEDILARRQEVRATKLNILSLFDDVPTVRDMVEGIMGGFTAAELRELTNFDEVTYNSNRRLIRRRIDAAYPKGWTP
jgi:DNA-directed RNA polymerase specialized sigma24 family protein